MNDDDTNGIMVPWCHDMVPLIHAMRCSIDLSLSLPDQCEAVQRYLLQLERTYGHCHQLDFFLHLKQLIYDHFIDNDPLHDDVYDPGSSVNSNVSIRNYLQRKGIEPVKKLFLEGISAHVQRLIRDSDTNAESPVLLSTQFSSQSNKKHKSQQGSSTGFYSFNFDDFPIYESIESILSLWGDDRSTVLEKLLVFDLNELIDHPLYEEVLQLLSGFINSCSALALSSCTSNVEYGDYVLALSILHRFINGFGASTQRLDAINCFLQHLFLLWVSDNDDDDDDVPNLNKHLAMDLSDGYTRLLFPCCRCQLTLLMVILQVFPAMVPLMGSSVKEMDRAMLLMLLLFSRGSVKVAWVDSEDSRRVPLIDVLMQMSAFVDGIVPFIAAIRPISLLVYATQSGFLILVISRLDALKQGTIMVERNGADVGQVHRLQSLCLFAQCLSAMLGSFASNCHLVKASIASQHLMSEVDNDGDGDADHRRHHYGGSHRRHNGNWIIRRRDYPSIRSHNNGYRRTHNHQRSSSLDYLQPIPRTNKSLFHFACFFQSTRDDDDDVDPITSPPAATAGSILDDIHPYHNHYPPPPHYHQLQKSPSDGLEVQSEAFDRWLQGVVTIVSTLFHEAVSSDMDAGIISRSLVILDTLDGIARISPSLLKDGFDVDPRNSIVSLSRMVFERSVAIDASHFEQSLTALLRVLHTCIVTFSATMHATDPHRGYDPVPVHFLHALALVLSIISHTNIDYDHTATLLLNQRPAFQRLWSGLLYATAVYLTDARFKDSVEEVLQQTALPFVLMVDYLSKELTNKTNATAAIDSSSRIVEFDGDDEVKAVRWRYVDCLCMLVSHEHWLHVIIRSYNGKDLLQGIVDGLLCMLVRPSGSYDGNEGDVDGRRRIVWAVLGITSTVHDPSFVIELLDMDHHQHHRRRRHMDWFLGLEQLFYKEYRDARANEHFGDNIGSGNSCYDGSRFSSVLQLFCGLLYQGHHRVVGSMVAHLWDRVVFNHCIPHDGAAIKSTSPSDSNHHPRIVHLLQQLPQLVIAIITNNPCIATISCESMYPCLLQLLSVALMDMSFDMEVVRLWKDQGIMEEHRYSIERHGEDECDAGVDVESVFVHMARRMIDSIMKCVRHDDGDGRAVKSCRHSLVPSDESELEDILACMHRVGESHAHDDTIPTALGGRVSSLAGMTKDSMELWLSRFGPLLGDDGGVPLVSVLSAITAIQQPPVIVLSQSMEVVAPTVGQVLSCGDVMQPIIEEATTFFLSYLHPSFSPDGGPLPCLVHHQHHHYHHDVNTFKSIVREGASSLICDKACVSLVFATINDGTDDGDDDGTPAKRISSSDSAVSGCVWLAAACSLLSPYHPTALITTFQQRHHGHGHAAYTDDTADGRSSSTILPTKKDFNAGGLIPLTMALVRRYRGGFIHDVFQCCGLPVSSLLHAMIRYWFFNHMTMQDVLVVTGMTMVHGIYWPALVATAILLHYADSINMTTTSSSSATTATTASTAMSVGTALLAIRRCGYLDLTHTLLPLMELILQSEETLRPHR